MCIFGKGRGKGLGKGHEFGKGPGKGFGKGHFGILFPCVLFLPSVTLAACRRP
jgi:hypothetical protein